MIYQNIEISEFQSLGNMSKYIDKDLLNRALLNCEISILQKWMGLRAFAEFDDYTEDIKQLIYRALAILANAWIMRNSTFTTRSGATEKQSSNDSDVLSGARLNSQVSQLRLEARELISQAEQKAVAEGHTQFDWAREVNILNLWHQSF